ncbi:hypothetical protein [Klebsiella pneumoniae]|uniref:hypothetical protein n=1 Tax=Klebsiella pneumoniae TaxID=573 RepID=UPI000D744413|nr:hypothetical protein [Klebsiella pneumoniae]PXJ00907.1 hypothetical protein DMQ70_18475 [Klebsiella pneumoniae]
MAALLRFRKAINVRARRQTKESPGAYIQYVTGVSERSQRGYGVFRKAINVRARRQTKESPGAYIQYVTGVSERSQRGYGVN